MEDEVQPRSRAGHVPVGERGGDGRDESLGGTRVFGPAEVPGTEVELGQVTDPERHLIGIAKAAIDSTVTS